MISQDTITISVITVVFNAEDKIKATIDSVVSQDYGNIEYIIKDGGSTDGTLGIIEEYASRYDFVRYVSESDSGIYDAMNIAVGMASGDVIHFLNAGDRFYSADVVSRAMKVMKNTDSDVVYGDVFYENPNGTTNVRAYPKSCSGKLYFLTGDSINHQVMFTDKRLFEPGKGGGLFDTSYKICADREWMLRVGVYRPRCKMTALGFSVAKYPLDGASVINKERYKAEADLCIRKYMPLGYPVYLLFEFARGNRIVAGLLHSIYKIKYFKT